MAENKTKKSGNKSSNKTSKRKNIEPGFFSDYGGSGITVIKRPKNDKK